MAVAVPIRRPRLFAPARARVVREVLSRPAGAFGVFVVFALLVFIIFASVISPYGDATQDIANRLQGPSISHPLGTDELGRDIFSRLVFGTRIALGVAVPSVTAALFIGLIIGMVAGYIGGRVDNVLLVVMDTLQAFPAVILALALL